METWKLYSIESRDFSWGYNLIYPINIIEHGNNTLRFLGWWFSTNDSQKVVSCSFGFNWYEIEYKNQVGEYGNGDIYYITKRDPYVMIRMIKAMFETMPWEQ